MKRFLAAVMAAAMLSVTAANAQTLWDNGVTDGSNGYSNFLNSSTGLGADRWVMDDFDTGGQTWSITDLHWTHIWNTFPVGSGTGLDFQIWSDNAGSPGSPIATANVTSYSEVATGNVFFGRNEAGSTANFDPIVLGPGHYWIHASVVGPENNFWMIHQAVTGSESWTDYSDLGFGPGTLIFGGPADLNFQLSGTVVTVPEPASLGLLALGSIMIVSVRRRRRSA